jgi:hypothetical protein
MFGGTEEDHTIHSDQLTHKFISSVIFSESAAWANVCGEDIAKYTRDFAVTVMIKITAESQNGRVPDNRLPVKQKPYSSPSFHPRKPPPN